MSGPGPLNPYKINTSGELRPSLPLVVTLSQPPPLMEATRASTSNSSYANLDCQNIFLAHHQCPTHRFPQDRDNKHHSYLGLVHSRSRRLPDSRPIFLHSALAGLEQKTGLEPGMCRGKPENRPYRPRDSVKGMAPPSLCGVT